MAVIILNNYIWLGGDPLEAKPRFRVKDLHAEKYWTLRYSSTNSMITFRNGYVQWKLSVQLAFSMATFICLKNCWQKEKYNIKGFQIILSYLEIPDSIQLFIWLKPKLNLNLSSISVSFSSSVSGSSLKTYQIIDIINKIGNNSSGITDQKN